MSEIAFSETPTKGVYTLTEPGGAVAELAFSKAGASMIIIEHTEVPDAFRGQGAGRRLVTRAVEDARAAGKKIMPLCPFARAEFGKHPEWADVWKR
ncbi:MULTISPECIES: GNAT family N-acetyltransferase [unclassified Aureimonas]|uniref:GNAT family N-acetyltransferase n=1 Tax=unclassified Aureimonas TaxID=2615206 RepID=UPI0006F3E94D|nr:MULTISPECIES: GNAT family N-acetyltransferase [unclassified Aureimonas]KQT65766.1 acetyltransferase [Aureimonas sp. Leaf427]KQT74766.1 acetyltransferase [Aureimonas sp. Leaf460]